MPGDVLRIFHFIPRPSPSFRDHARRREPVAFIVAVLDKRPNLAAKLIADASKAGIAYPGRIEVVDVVPSRGADRNEVAATKHRWAERCALATARIQAH
jgi:hypothetical protein